MLGQHKLIPFGEMQGRTLIEVDLREVDLDDDLALTQAVLQLLHPGTAAIELQHAPWGTPQLDRALMLLASDTRTSEIEVWCHRPITELRWSAIPVWWCLDASAFFTTALTATELINAINSLPYLPTPAELVVFDPHEHAVTHVLLDELHTRLDAGMGWLYVPPASPAWDAAEAAIARASSSWGLRAAVLQDVSP